MDYLLALTTDRAITIEHDLFTSFPVFNQKENKEASESNEERQKNEIGTN